MTTTEHNQQWFIDRIGKRIYRKNNFCQCPVCLDVHENGLIVQDEMHACYLYDCQSMDLIYYDKEETNDIQQETNRG